MGFFDFLSGFQTYYLNNSGSKWVVRDRNGKSEKIKLKTKSGKTIERSVIRYESFGNFAVAVISYKGKIKKVFPDDVLED